MGATDLCDKLRKSKCINSLFSLENGIHVSAKNLAERERLHMQNRPERCLLCVPMN